MYLLCVYYSLFVYYLFIFCLSFVYFFVYFFLFIFFIYFFLFIFCLFFVYYCVDKCNEAIANAFKEFWLKEQIESNEENKVGVAICFSYLR